MTLLERSGQFQNLWRYNLVNKQLQYTYLPKSQKVKAKSGNEIWSVNIITGETLFLKNHTQIVVEKLFPGLF